MEPKPNKTPAPQTNAENVKPTSRLRRRAGALMLAAAVAGGAAAAPKLLSHGNGNAAPTDTTPKTEIEAPPTTSTTQAEVAQIAESTTTLPQNQMITPNFEAPTPTEAPTMTAVTEAATETETIQAPEEEQAVVPEESTTTTEADKPNDEVRTSSTAVIINGDGTCSPIDPATGAVIGDPKPIENVPPAAPENTQGSPVWNGTDTNVGDALQVRASEDGQTIDETNSSTGATETKPMPPGYTNPNQQ